MKASKIFVLLAGLLGIASLFLPLVKGKAETAPEITAFAFLKDIYSAPDAAKVDADASADNGATDAKKVELRDSKWVLAIMFVPAVFLLLLGLVGVGSGKFGRGAGTLAMLIGLVSGGCSALFLVGTQKPDSTVVAGYGLYGILAAGAIGALFGLIALISPDRGQAA